MATLYGGTLSDYDSSDNMAKVIESAYSQMRISAGIADPLPSGPDAQDMRLLFLAIARGIIAYLAAHPTAFQVQVTLESNSDVSDGNVTQINTTS